jgi:hypothetical protein
METGKALLMSGVTLLAIAALLGFVQYRHRERAEDFARWRVVHAGGTAGAVQLMVLSAVWSRIGRGTWMPLVAAGLIVATWTFFLGSLATALGQPRTAQAINRIGTLFAVPAYLALPLLVLS